MGSVLTDGDWAIVKLCSMVTANSRVHQPGGALLRGSDDCRLDRTAVRLEIPGNGGEVQEGYAEGRSDHVLLCE